MARSLAFVPETSFPGGRASGLFAAAIRDASASIVGADTPVSAATFCGV